MNIQTNPLISVILGSYNRRVFLAAALESVRNNGMDFSYEIIVVDGGSTDGSMKYLQNKRMSLPLSSIIAVNFAAKKSHAETGATS